MPEPENPQDAKAITFQCFISNDWQTIGYVVREALDEVHLAISNHKIASVRLKWVKYIIYWKTPAWYAGIDIVRVGEWPRHVLLSQSVKLCVPTYEIINKVHTIQLKKTVIESNSYAHKNGEAYLVEEAVQWEHCDIAF